ncbi:MAG TPA: competence/damage-inducible protein A [bacterium]|nr:competence/damage-inducible protein A [bacterium]
MKIEIITIGDEVLSGAITDTNFAWLGERLWSRGYELHWHTTVGDEPEKIAEALLKAAERSRAVIVTGGLGPTLDDITIEAAARAFGQKLVLNEVALQAIKNRFKKIGRDMTPNNEKQALLPEGSLMIPNKIGTAPGCHAVHREAHYFFMPGVPREMHQQFEDSVLPELMKLEEEKRAYAFKLLRCFGAPEATMAQRLEGMELTGIDLAYRVSFPEILIKISSWGPDPTVLERRVTGAATEIHKRLADWVYAEGEETFPALIGRLLREKGATLATAESCTGGQLAHLVTNVPGSSAYFDRGVVTYSNASKTEILGVPQSLLKTFGAVSPETATAMAKGVRKLAKTTYGIGITGIAGPDGGTTEKPVGTVHIALDAGDGTVERELHFATTREWFKKVVAFAAMDLLRKKLLGLLKT